MLLDLPPRIDRTGCKTWNGCGTDRQGPNPLFPSLLPLSVSLQFKETRLTLRYSAVQLVSPHIWRCKNHHCSVGGLLCAILVTMCTGGYPGVAGTPGASQRHQLDRVLNTEWSAFYLVMLDWVLLRVVFQLDRVSVKHRVIFTWSC